MIPKYIVILWARAKISTWADFHFCCGEYISWKSRIFRKIMYQAPYGGEWPRHCVSAAFPICRARSAKRVGVRVRTGASNRLRASPAWPILPKQIRSVAVSVLHWPVCRKSLDLVANIKKVVIFVYLYF